jgi:xanthine/CO dehydrogenase XdhC/CoxF family maturation factor
VTYDTRSPDDLVWGFGLGCGGLIELLVESLDPDHAAAKAEQLRAIAGLRQRAVLATVIRSSEPGVTAGAQALLADASSTLNGFDDLDPTLRTTIHRAARQALRSGASIPVRHQVGAHQTDIAYEVIAPALRLTVCGAGPDAIPVMAAAKRLGWVVTLLDHRPALMIGERWPAVNRTVVPSLEAIPDAVAAVECDAVVIMNHHYERDFEFLAAWLRSEVPYIGLLGPRQRSEQMLATLHARGMDLESALGGRIRAPVGLDLGAETPEEIALAIVAEVQAVRAGRGAGFLTSRDGPIHDQGGRNGAVSSGRNEQRLRSYR